MKQGKMKIAIKTLTVLGIMALYTTEALAVTASSDASVTKMIDFLKSFVIENMAYISAVVAFIIACIAAVGNKIGPVIVDNIGKVMFFAFGGTILTAGLTAAGALVM